MSNLESTIQYLRQDPEKHFLKLLNLENNQSFGPAKVLLSSIPNGDLASFIKFQLGNTTIDTDVWVEHRYEVGTTTRKSEKHPSYKILVRAAVPPAPVQVPQADEIAPKAIDAVPMAQQNYNFLGNPGHALGLGFTDILKMNVDSVRLEDMKTALVDAKEDLKEVKHELRTLQIDHRELMAKYAVAESQKDMAVMLAKNETRSFFDTEAFQNIMERAPELIQAYKGIAPAPAAPGLGRPNVSEGVNQVLDYMADNCSEEQAKYIGSIFHFIDQPQFLADLSELLTRYKSHDR